MTLTLRSSSATSAGTPTTTSLGGYASNAAPSGTNGVFFDDITTSQNDAQTVDYRCVFIYNTGPNTVTGIKVNVVNAGSGATVSVGTNAASAAAIGSYTASTVASETTAPTITTGWSSQVTIGDLTSGQVRHVWLKRAPLKDIAKTNDGVQVIATGTEVIPA